MSYQVMRLLEREEVDRLVSGLDERVFEDGRATARGRAREVKHNLQTRSRGPAPDELEETVLRALQRSPEFQNFAIPKRAVKPMFSRYDPGMQYGSHVDSALMHGVRSDFAVTLFLSQPAGYDGGALVIELPHGEEEIKLDAGEAIVYSADTVHHVEPVTRGVRLAAVTWVQSMVHDERLRAVLWDLHRSVKSAETSNNHELSLLLGKSYHNLLRYAAET